MEINVVKAAGIRNQVVIPDAIIHIGPLEPPLAIADYERQYRVFYEDEASRLMKALASLPGGTWDRLLCLMLEKKASLFRVPLFEAAPKPPILQCDYCAIGYFQTEDKLRQHIEFTHTHIIPAPAKPMCRGCGGLLHDGPCTPPKQSVTSDFPTIIQAVLSTAECGAHISMDESTTQRLASEIRKLLERP